MKIRLVATIIALFYSLASSYAVNGNGNVDRRPTHIMSTAPKYSDGFIVKLYEKNPSGFRKEKRVLPGDSIYPIESMDTLNLSSFEREKYIVGFINGRLCLVYKDFADELAWQDGVAINLREQTKKERKESFERFKSLFMGPNLYSGNGWYYMLGLVLASVIVIMLVSYAFDIWKEGNVKYVVWTYIAAVAMILLYAYEFSVPYFGTKLISDWLKSLPGDEFWRALLMLPISLAVIVLVAVQFRYWCKLMGLLGIIAKGRESYGLTVIIMIIGIIAMVACVLFSKHNLMKVLSIMAILFGVDLLLTVFFNRRNMVVVLLTVILTLVGIAAMIEMFTNFGVVFAAIGGTILIIIFVVRGSLRDYIGKFTIKYDVYKGVTKVGTANVDGDIKLDSMGNAIVRDGEILDLVKRE